MAINRHRGLGIKRFQPLSKLEEELLLQAGTHSKRLFRYLEPLIEDIARLGKVDKKVKQELLSEVSDAARDFLRATRRYKFSTFLSWRIRKRIKELNFNRR